MPDRSHALVVGGTGMLAGVSLHLSRAGGGVSVIARNPVRVYDLQRRAVAQGGRIHPLIVNYCNATALRAAIDSAVAKHGPFDQIVSWIHADGSIAIDVIAEHLRSNPSWCDWLEVIGSSAADPSPQLASSMNSPNIHHRRAVLGFEIEGGRSRWLTNDEISAGVMDAIGNGQAHTIIGRIEPWSSRPA